jgi:hypothetical protein
LVIGTFTEAVSQIQEITRNAIFAICCIVAIIAWWNTHLTRKANRTVVANRTLSLANTSIQITIWTLSTKSWTIARKATPSTPLASKRTSYRIVAICASCLTCCSLKIRQHRVRLTWFAWNRVKALEAGSGTGKTLHVAIGSLERVCWWRTLAQAFCLVLVKVIIWHTR